MDNLSLQRYRLNMICLLPSATNSPQCVEETAALSAVIRRRRFRKEKVRLNVRRLYHYCIWTVVWSKAKRAVKRMKQCKCMLVIPIQQPTTVQSLLNAVPCAPVKKITGDNRDSVLTIRTKSSTVRYDRYFLRDSR